MTAEIFIQRFPPFGFVVIGGIFDEKACVGKVGWHCYANSVILIVKQILNNKKIKCSLHSQKFSKFLECRKPCYAHHISTQKKKLLEEASLEFFTIPRVKD